MYDDQEYLTSLPPIPKTLSESLDALEKDRAWAEKALGKDVLTWHVQNRRHEAEHYGAMEEKVRKKELIQYF